MKDGVEPLVNGDFAGEPAKRALGCDVRSDKKNDGTYEIHLSRAAGTNTSSDEKFVAVCENPAAQSGPFVIVISEDKMGRGNDELGYVLIKAFFHTLCQQENKPDVMIFYNTGVKLTVQNSEVLDDLKQLEAAGVEILVCGTCLNYFELKDKLGAGMVSNMYDISGTMSRAGRLVTP